MSRLDDVTLSFFIPEDDTHHEIPRLGERVTIAIDTARGDSWQARYIVTRLDEVDRNGGRAVVVAALDDDDNAPDDGIHHKHPIRGAGDGP